MRHSPIVQSNRQTVNHVLIGKGTLRIINSTLFLAISYGLILGLSAFSLQWLQSQLHANLFPVEIYIVIIALAFTILGVWIGNGITPKNKAGSFEKNEAALKSLGVTPREYDVLEILAAGHSNKQIARSLNLSPNTVKTHISNLFFKLEVSRRTQAIRKARELSLIP